MSCLHVNLDLVRKYDVPGPRYTSYPPATRFTEAISWDSLRSCIEANNRLERPLSLYFHIPFCQALCWFCGCTTVITRNRDQPRAYVELLRRELALMAPRLHPGRRVVQLHWGGGSPSFLPPTEIRRLGDIIRQQFTLADDIEAGVEVDPRDLTRDHLAAFREAGFNRVSMGVQDFDARVQQAVHRLQPRELTERSVAWARELGFGSVNLDLIYGLPYQTLESFERTLDGVMALNPDRLAVFSYAHVPWLKPAQKILARRPGLPAPEVKLQLLKLAVEKLTGDGRYVYIGMDHFARPGDELAVAQRQKKLQRNFQGYSTRAGADIYAFGMSSISQIPEAYWQNLKSLPAWQDAVQAGRVPLYRGYFVSQEDKIRRETIMRVMCDLSLDYAALSRSLGIPFQQHFARELASLDDLEADGLVRRTAAGLEVTDLGRLFIRNIAMRFDNQLTPPGEQRHSRTI